MHRMNYLFTVAAFLIGCSGPSGLPPDAALTADLAAKPPPPATAPDLAPVACSADVQSDLQNCGQCGNACPTAASIGEPNGAMTCAAGQCTLACTPPYGACGPGPILHCNTNVSTDPKNCGACGKVCLTASPDCVSGTCK